MICIQVAKGVGVSSRALNGAQLSRTTTTAAAGGSSSRHALLGCAIALLTIIVATHPCVVAGLWRLARLLRWWLSVAVVARWRPWRASRKTRESIAIEHGARFRVSEGYPLCLCRVSG